MINDSQATHLYGSFLQAYKGYIRMMGDEEKEWLDTMNMVHSSVKGGMKYNTGKLLMVLYKPLVEEE